MTDEEKRLQNIEARNRQHAAAIRRELDRKQNQKVRDFLQWWADNTPERERAA